MKQLAQPSKKERDDALVLEYLHLAEAVARRYFRRNTLTVQNEDLQQVAYMGLIKASRRFDPGKGENFVSFAVPTISGEVKRHLRDNEWFIRPPRHIQELRSRVSEATPRLTQVLGRTPGRADLASDLDESERTIDEAINSQQHRYPTSLDVAVGNDGLTLADVLGGPDDALERAELAAAIRPAFYELRAREQHIIYLRYFEERTQQEIADELGLTQMQISRLLTKILLQLRTRITYGPAKPGIPGPAPSKPGASKPRSRPQPGWSHRHTGFELKSA